MNQHLERLDGLAPFLRQPVLRLIELAQQKLSARLLVVHGFRSVQEQALIYQQGRTFDREAGVWKVSDPAKVVTQAKPGSSAHNVITMSGQPAGLAVDLIPLDGTGQPNWNPTAQFWTDLYALAWKCGLDPYGDVIGAYLPGDQGHFEEPGWKLKLDGWGFVLPAPTVANV